MNESEKLQIISRIKKLFQEAESMDEQLRERIFKRMAVEYVAFESITLIKRQDAA